MRARTLGLLALVTAMGLGCGSDEASTDTGASTTPGASTAGTSAPPSGASTTAAAPTTTAAPPSTSETSSVTGSPVSAPQPPASLVLGDAGTYTLAVGAHTSLRLEGDSRGVEPAVEGDAVELVRVAFESDPGYDQYDIVGSTPGEATVRVDVAGTASEFTFIVS